VSAALDLGATIIVWAHIIATVFGVVALGVFVTILFWPRKGWKR